MSALSSTQTTSTAPAETTDGCGGELPTTPCSVVWSCGHSYVLEGSGSGARWAGVDDRGRALFLTDADLHRRGWSRSPS